jgi:hypothetical protein
MIFKTYAADAVIRLFFRGYFCATIFLALLSLIGFISDAGTSSTFCGIVYLLAVAFLSLAERFQKNPFSILFCFFTFLYLNIPAAFILAQGSKYVFGEGLAAVPFEQAVYAQSLPLGFLCLTSFWIMMWLAIISVRPRIRKIDSERFSLIGLKPVFILGLVVLVATWIDNQVFADVILTGAERSNSMFAFVFFDHAYLVMTGLVLFFKLNETRHLNDPRRVNRLLLIIFVGFVVLSFISGSKAAVLVIFMLFLIYPLCFFRMYPQAMVSLPRPGMLVILVMLAPPMFYFALIQRISLATGTAPDLTTLLAGLSQIDTAVLRDTFTHILYRFSQGGLDRFLLIFQSFAVDGLDLGTADKFLHYMAENAANLVLPGTPFPESYAPSSQLFPQILDKSISGGEIASSALIKSFNTQPYTIFGIFLVIFGLAGPIFLYFSIFAFVYTFNRIGNIFLKMTMLYFFESALSSYGLEVVFGNSVHLIVSILIMYFFSKLLSRISLRTFSKSKTLPLHA